MKRLRSVLKFIPVAFVLIVVTLWVPFSRRRLSRPFDRFWQRQRPDEVDAEISAAFEKIKSREEKHWREHEREWLTSHPQGFGEGDVGEALNSVFTCLKMFCSRDYPNVRELKNTLEAGKWHACTFGAQGFIERIAVSEVMATTGADDALISFTKREVKAWERVWKERIGVLMPEARNSGTTWFFCNQAIPDAALVLAKLDDDDLDREFHMAVDLGTTCGTAIEAMMEARSLREIVKSHGLESLGNVAFFSEQQSALGRFGSANANGDPFGAKGFNVTFAAANDLGRLRFQAAGWTASHAVVTATCNWVDR